MKILIICYIGILFIASIRDIKTKRIERWIPLLIGIIALILQLQKNTLNIGNLFAGFMLGGFPFFVIAFACGTNVMGGGDVKFMAANGMLLGLEVIVASIIGLFLASLFLMICAPIYKKRGKELKGTALAPFLGVGCLIVLLKGGL